MASKAKRSVKKKTVARKPAKKKVSVKKVAKGKSRRIAVAKKAVRRVVKSAGETAATATETGKGLVRRAVDAITQAAAPLIPGNATEKPKID